MTPKKVFVSGCYDLLHSGHVEFFRQAADYLPTQFVCEYIRLVVGADGIIFPSSRLEEGTNIVLFDKNCASLKDSYQKTVGRVFFKFEDA